MEFSKYENFSESFIDNLQNVHKPWVYCRYLQNKWLPNPNLFTEYNNKVLPKGLNVITLLRDGNTYITVSDECDFAINNYSKDIIAYKISGTSKGYKYEWED